MGQDNGSPARARETAFRWLRGWWGDDRTRFVVAFVLLAGCLLAFYYFPRTDNDAIESWTAEYLRLYTRVVSWPIRVFDPGASAHGNLVAGRFSMQVVKSCDAMEANILFTSALLAFSAPLWRKAVALAVGLAALVGFNLIRLFVLYWVGVFVPSAFDFLHLDIWPLLMIAFAATDFVLCIRWVRGAEVAPAAAS
jgi:exosortase/archaeosortase family protein